MILLSFDGKTPINCPLVFVIPKDHFIIVFELHRKLIVSSLITEETFFLYTN